MLQTDNKYNYYRYYQQEDLCEMELN